MDPGKLSKFRAEVIEKFINLEFLLNAIISQHYFGRISRQFLLDVLYDEYFSFALKRRILEKILKAKSLSDRGMLEDLNRLNNIRNYFAHIGVEFLGAGGMGSVPNPKNPKESVDFESLHREFLQKEKPAREFLLKALSSLGGRVERAGE